MKIHLRQIPVEGLHLEGIEERDLLDIQEPGIGPAGPIHYSLDAGISGDGLFASGTLETEVELRCVRCLETFKFPIRVEDFAVQVELTGAETVDLTPYIREDILLCLPAHPRCDWREKICRGAGEWKTPSEKTEQTERKAAVDAWEALDKLRVKTTE
jgi:uncharacterized metal-binding protein YceD (DUF177 family)